MLILRARQSSQRLIGWISLMLAVRSRFKGLRRNEGWSIPRACRRADALPLALRVLSWHPRPSTGLAAAGVRARLRPCSTTGPAAPFAPTAPSQSCRRSTCTHMCADTANTRTRVHAHKCKCMHLHAAAEQASHVQAPPPKQTSAGLSSDLSGHHC